MKIIVAIYFPMCRLASVTTTVEMLYAEQNVASLYVADAELVIQRANARAVILEKYITTVFIESFAVHYACNLRAQHLGLACKRRIVAEPIVPACVTLHGKAFAVKFSVPKLLYKLSDCVFSLFHNLRLTVLR